MLAKSERLTARTSDFRPTHFPRSLFSHRFKKILAPRYSLNISKSFLPFSQKDPLSSWLAFDLGLTLRLTLRLLPLALST
jgi:hypothetical protein